MSAPSLRRALIPITVLLLIAVLTGTGSAASEGPGRARSDAVGTSSAGHEGASVDPLLIKRLARGEPVEALVSLDGASVLASARVPAAGDSRDLLRTTVPAYRALKDGVTARVPRLTVLSDYRTLPILHVRIDSQAELARIASDLRWLGSAPTVATWPSWPRACR
jgi:hypothetical protein